MKYSYIFGFAALAFLAGCKNNIQPTAPQKGNANFTKYVAIGNSLTAGYGDGSLYKSGQENAYPAILAAQFAAVGGGDFKTPYLLDDNGYPGMKNVLGYKEDCATGVLSLAPVPLDGTVNPANGDNISAQGPFNNLGIPGIRLLDMAIPYYATLNPYSKRFLSATEATGTMLDYVVASNPTFFTCWLGSNDVLGYAGSGGTGSASGFMPSDITPLANFKTIYDDLITKMVANGAQGVLITIPDVTSTPAFNTIPYNGLVLEREGQVDSLNAAYSPLGISFILGNNPFIIADATAPGGMRKMKEGELIILSAIDSIKCGGWGSKKPLPDAATLDNEEMGYITTATKAFNDIIKDNAARHNLAIFDANEYLKTLAPGMVWNGAKYNLSFIAGGLFALDGVHLNPRGYALVANGIMKAINEKYGSSLEMVDINNYRSNIFP